MTLLVALGGLSIGMIAKCAWDCVRIKRLRAERDERNERIEELERNKADLALKLGSKREEWRYRSLLQATRIMLIALDSDGVIVDFDAVSSELTGFSFYEIAGKRFTDVFLSGDDLPTFKSALEQVHSGDVKRDLELDLNIKGGFKRTLSLVLLAISNEEESSEAVMIAGRDVTDLRLAERRQIENQRHIRQIIENVPVVLFSYSPDGNLVYLSENAEKIYGVPNQKIFERNDIWIDSVHPDDREKVRRHWSDSVEERRDSSLSFRIILPNGETLWVERRCRIVFDNNAQIQAILGITIDLTSHKEAERELMDSEERYRLLFENAHDAIILMDDETFLDCNKKALELFRCEKDQFVHHPPSDFSPKTQPDGSPSNVKEKQVIGAAWNGEPQRFIWRHHRADGEEFDAEVSLTPMHIRDERFLLAILRDVTMNIKMERALRESERRYSEFFNNMQSGVFIYDVAEEGDKIIIRDVNETCERITGMRRGDIVGRDVLDVSPMLLESPLPDVFKRVARSGRMENPPPFPIMVEGEERWIDTYVFKLPAGEVVSIFEDITEDRAMRLEKERLTEQLRQSQKMQAIGQLAGGLAHDFNNLLAGIMNYGEMLELSDAVPENQRKWAGSIVKTASKGADLISQLMSFARKEQNVSVLFDLHDAINQAVSILGRTIDRSIHIDARLNAENSLVSGDPSEMENAILNIALNARDAMPNGGELTFATRNDDIDEERRRTLQLERPGEYIRLEITDTGTGMPPEIIDKVFEPFFTTKQDGKGTGLGLAGVFGCVKSHDGAIEVESAFGKGSSLIVHLPIRARGEGAPNARTDSETMIGGEGEIMVVDDEQVVREGVVMVLRKLGYEAEGFADGQKALTRFRRNHAAIKLVVIDMVMPKMNGLALFRELKTIDPNVRALILSGFSDPSMMDQAMSEGVVGFVKKPVRAHDLSKAVADAVKSTSPSKG